MFDAAVATDWEHQPRTGSGPRAAHSPRGWRRHHDNCATVEFRLPLVRVREHCNGSDAVRSSPVTLRCVRSILLSLVLALAFLLAGCSTTPSSAPKSPVRPLHPGSLKVHGVSTTTAPPTTTAPLFTAFVGTWALHDTAGLTIDGSGHGTVGVPDFTACPPVRKQLHPSIRSPSNSHLLRLETPLVQ